METAFLLSLFLIFHVYFGYPLSLIIIGLFKKKSFIRDEIYPQVTVIITAHNEMERIIQKLENTKKIKYPRDKLQIIVASDGSTDKTNEIVKSYLKDGIELLPIFPRQGKEHAQHEAVNLAKGEILVFTDVATILEPDSITSIVSNFADPRIGCVSSVDRLIGRDGKPSGEGLYVKYEMWLRKLESRVNSLVGLSGSFFAARKEVCMDFSSNLQSDFRTLLNSKKMGLSGTIDFTTIGYYNDIANESYEFNRKVRTVLRGITVFINNLEFLNFTKYGLFSYQYFCHKLLRWTVPALLILAFACNLIVSQKSDIYMLLLVLQTLFYVSGILGILGIIKAKSKLIKLPQYFITVNYSILTAWIKFFKGEKIVQWQPSKR